MEIEEDALILRKPRAPRAGWEAAARAIVAAGEDGLVWPEFGNDDDSLLEW